MQLASSAVDSWWLLLLLLHAHLMDDIVTGEDGSVNERI